MKVSDQRKKKKVLLTGSVLLFCAAVGLTSLLWFVSRVHGVPFDPVRKTDLAELSQDSFEGVLLSMYTPEFFDAEDFDYFLGIHTVQAFHTFKNLADIGNYLEQCFLYNPDPAFVYIGLDPYAVSSLYGNHASLYIRDYENYLVYYAQAHPDTDFKLLFPSHSLEYLRSLSEDEYAELVTAYRNLVNMFIPYDNIIIYFAGYEEWLIANPGNYDSVKICNSNVLHTILAFTLRDDHYVLNTDNMEERFAHMTELVQASPADYPDLSQWCIICFGDSVLEYNSGSYSVTGVVEGLSGAQVYNCSQGGMPATGGSGAALSFDRMVTRFLEQDTSGLEKEMNYVKRLNEYMLESHEGKKYCFLLNFGLNDYFQGYPVENPEDRYDAGTYAGALRTGIRTLKDAYPDAEIILMTPTYSIQFSGGTKKNSAQGGVLTDYVEAALRVAGDMEVRCINNYEDSGINKDTQAQYLADGTHPNVTGAFLLGNQILREIERIIED